jgi:hypothetical protein
MKVRESNVSISDKHSAELFFRAVTGFWDLSGARALDAFARNGQLTVPYYYRDVEELHLWELGREHVPDLSKFSPKMLKIGDSYTTAAQNAERFDFIVIDTPQGAHRDAQGETHYEHFDFFRIAMQKLAKDSCVVVLYVNKSPYDKAKVGSFGYDEYEEYDFAGWMDARREYYGVSPIGIGEEEALAAYRHHATQEGFRVANALMVPCFSDVPDKAPYAFRLALELVRN